MAGGELIRRLTGLALSLGASGASEVPAGEIKVRDDLAGLCQKPRCEGYGLSPSCPPHVSGPRGFRRLLENYRRALALKMDLPTELLLSPQRSEAMRVLHETAASLEGFAREMGCGRAQAFAGGSCKKIFCDDRPQCKVLASGGPCRHPEAARPSLSGFGIDVAALMASAGWSLAKITGDTDPKDTPSGSLAALLLLE